MQELLISEIVHLLFVALQVLVMTLLPILIIASIRQIRNTTMRNYAMTLVRYAAQRLPDNSSKYSYVAGALCKRFRFMNERDTAHLIEAAVHAMKEADRTLNQTVELSPPNIEVTAPTAIVTTDPEVIRVEHQ